MTVLIATDTVGGALGDLERDHYRERAAGAYRRLYERLVRSEARA